MSSTDQLPNDGRIQFATGQSSLGPVLVARSARGACAIFMGDDQRSLLRDLERQFSGTVLARGDAQCEALLGAVLAFIESPDAALDLPLDVRGSDFQRRVWEALRDIPAGETASYAEIARRIGEPGSARAVAQACAANAIALAIPCHRVVRGDGTVSGYRWGVERKRALLSRERALRSARTTKVNGVRSAEDAA